MIICFDAGNTDLVAGIFCDDKIVNTLRIPYKKEQSADDCSFSKREGIFYWVFCSKYCYA